MALSDMLLRGWQKIAQGKESALSEMSTSRYKFFEATSPFTNKSGQFIVGLHITGGTLIQENVTFMDGVNFTVQPGSIAQSVPPSGASTTIKLFDGVWSVDIGSIVGIHNVLIPPEFQLTSITNRFLAVICRSLDDALALL